MHRATLKSDKARFSLKDRPRFGNIRSKFAQIQGFWSIIQFESLDLSDFAYFNRKTRYLTDNSGPVAEKEFRVKFGPDLDFVFLSEGHP